VPPLFSSPAFPSVKFIENGVLREETFVARRKMAFLDRKLLSLGEKWRFWTGNFCRSEKNDVFGQETFVARRKMTFLDRKLLSLGGDQDFSLFSRLSFLSSQKKPRKQISPMDLFFFQQL